MGDRFTFLVDDENAAWLEAEADERDRSRAWTLNECIRLARGENSAFEHTSDKISNDMHPDEDRISDERLDELEKRLGELESRVEGSPMAHERDARADDGQAADGVESDGPSPVENQNPSERAVSGSERPALEDVVEGAYQNRKFREERREIGVTALEWLREQSEPQSGSDFQNALHPEHNVNEQNADTWWRTTARPAVQAAVDAGLVEYREGHHDYRWTG